MTTSQQPPAPPTDRDAEPAQPNGLDDPWFQDEDADVPELDADELVEDFADDPSAQNLPLANAVRAYVGALAVAAVAAGVCVACM